MIYLAEPTIRYAAVIEYDGTHYHGWQYQDHCKTIQEAVEKALSTVANHPVSVVCAGRTDAGVHGRGQVIHFDTHSQRADHAWLLGCNSNLPRDISMLKVKAVSSDFHARYSATARTYRYVILSRRVRPALHRDRVCWIHSEIEASRMHEAAQALLGEHDFTSFRAAGCQSNTPMRNVRAISVTSQDNGWVYIDITANAFLHHMVRNIAGTLIEVGRGKQSVEWVADVLEQRDRCEGGVTAPACGLYFVSVEYPETFGLPEVDSAPIFN